MSELSDPPDQPRYHPRNNWGKLARDPWMQMGAGGEEWREVLRRIWWRQGGSDETFEQMIPPTATRNSGNKPSGDRG